jgi:hypothetical protein
MAAAKHKTFTEFSKEGREFIRLWNAANRDGIQKRLAERFGISVALVYRIRKKLGLPDLHDYKKHPGKRRLYKRIRRLYVNKERSTLQIAKIVRMNDENVRKILLKMNVSLRAQHVTNPAYFRTGSFLTPAQLLKEIKRLYSDEHLPATHIAKKLKIDEGTVRTKLKALDIKIEVRKVFEEQIVVAPNRNVKGIYLGSSEPYMVIQIPAKTVTHKGRSLEKRSKAKCQWCATVFPQYVDKGPRTQKFCCSSCSNRAKDYRRLLKGSKPSRARLKSMEKQLRGFWGDRYDDARGRLLAVQPIFKNEVV